MRAPSSRSCWPSPPAVALPRLPRTPRRLRGRVRPLCSPSSTGRPRRTARGARCCWRLCWRRRAQPCFPDRVQWYPPRNFRPPLLTPRPDSLAQGPPGADGDVPGSVLSPPPRPAAGPDARWRRPSSSGLVYPGQPAKKAAAAVHVGGARCSSVPDFSSSPCARVAHRSVSSSRSCTVALSCSATSE